MREKRSLAIIPGGFEDATLFCQGKDRTFLATRKGFVKYALQFGYKLQPIYSFGESDTYTTFTRLLSFRLWLNTFAIPGVAFFGEPLMPLFPRKNSKVYTYVGEPLQLPVISEPTKEQVDEWHGKYVAALRELFEKNKAEAGKPDATLEVW